MVLMRWNNTRNNQCSNTDDKMIWDRQEGETVNQYCWFQEFLQHDDYSLKNFHEKLNMEGMEKEQKSQKKKKIPTYKTIQNWSSCNNWMKRKEAYNIHKVEQQTHRLEEAEYKNKELINQKKNTIILKLLNRLDKEIDNELSGYQSNQFTSAITNLLDDNRKDLGKATSITENKSQLQIESEQVTTETIYDKVDKQLGIIEDGNQEV